MRPYLGVGSAFRMRVIMRRWLLGMLLGGIGFGWPLGGLRAQGKSAENGCRKGSYSNENYLYSIALPKGISCCQDLPPSAVHGCGITLPRGSKLWVAGSYNAMDYNSADDALRSTIGSNLVVGTTLTVLRHEPTKLGGFEAERLTLRTKRRGEAETKVKDLVMAMASREGGRGEVVYTIGFEGPETEYSMYEKIFSQIVASWKAVEPAAH